MQLIVAIFLSGVLLPGSVSAALINRGGGLIFDDVLNVTWLQDANYAFTSGYSTADGGAMPWADANAWAAQLSYFDSVRNVSYTGWRLPTVRPINGSGFIYPGAYDGSTDYGYNVGAPGTLYAGSTGSELAYMYFTNLGNISFYDTTGTAQPGYGEVNSGPFINVVRETWSSTEYAPNQIGAWTFINYGVLSGFQDWYPKVNDLSAWAVHDGDIAGAVPEPASLFLLGFGIVGLGFSRRRKQKAA